MEALLMLCKDIAKSFNQDLPPALLAELSGKMMSKDAFQEYVRQKLAKQALAKAHKPVVLTREQQEKKEEEDHEDNAFLTQLALGTSAASALVSGALLI
jgi:hypothetical protein